MPYVRVTNTGCPPMSSRIWENWLNFWACGMSWFQTESPQTHVCVASTTISCDWLSRLFTYCKPGPVWFFVQLFSVDKISTDTAHRAVPVRERSFSLAAPIHSYRAQRLSMFTTAWDNVITHTHKQTHTRTETKKNKRVAVWHSSNALVSINEVNLRWARLVVGWVTVSGFDSRRRHFIAVCNQSPRSTQLSTLRGTVNWVPAKGRWCSAAGK